MAITDVTLGEFQDLSAPLTAQGVGGAFSEMASTDGTFGLSFTQDATVEWGQNHS